MVTQCRAVSHRPDLYATHPDTVQHQRVRVSRWREKRSNHQNQPYEFMDDYGRVSLEISQTSNNMDMEKQRWEESERRRQEVKRSEKRKIEKEEDAGARKGRKVAKHYFFRMILWLWRVEK